MGLGLLDRVSAGGRARGGTEGVGGGLPRPRPRLLSQGLPRHPGRRSVLARGTGPRTVEGESSGTGMCLLREALLRVWWRHSRFSSVLLCFDVGLALWLFCMLFPLVLRTVVPYFARHSHARHPRHPLLIHSSPTFHSILSPHSVAASHAVPLVAECAYSRALLGCHGPATTTATITATSTAIAIRTTVVIVILVVQSKRARCVRDRHGDRNGCTCRCRGRHGGGF
jgi:hypothetical protein